jgi:hypothetical protein
MSIDGVLFSKDGSILKLYPRAKEGDVVIPTNVTTIGSFAFQNCGLTNVVIPNSVITIEERAFANNKLTSIVIPDSVTTIGMSAFASCGLTNVVIPNSVTTIKEEAFAYNKLTSIVIPDSVKSIVGGVFRGNQITSVRIGANVKVLDVANSALGGLMSNLAGGDAPDASAISPEFDAAYTANGSKAGTYTSSNEGKWSYRP